MGKKESVTQVKKFKQKLEQKMLVQQMILFGSRAQGKSGNDTDYDIMIVSPEFRKKEFFLRGARMYDSWDIPYPVDFLCYTPEEFKKLKQRISIVKVALKEGIEI